MSVKAEQRERRSTPAGGEYVSLTYRYLRIGMAATVVAIFVAVIVQAGHAKWTFLGSLSAYYYTPAQFVFVASLVAIGVCLIAIRGRNEWEDGLLNLAGMFAVIVAIVPTPQVGDCLAPPPNAVLALSPTVQNNLLTYLLVGTLVLIGSTVAALRALGDTGRGAADTATRFIALMPALLIGALGWYAYFYAWGFVTLCAHPLAAISLFGCITAVVVINAFGAQGARRLIYVGIAVAMLAGGAVIVLGRQSWIGHWVLTLEAVEIALFAIFWTVQTLDAQQQKAPVFDRYPKPPLLRI